jgi:(2Fe-2S) ferredoxin
MKKIDAPDKVIFICDGKKCGEYCKELRKEFRVILKENGLKKQVDVVTMNCSDNCKNAPVISLQPQNIWIGEVAGKNVKGIVKEYFL